MQGSRRRLLLAIPALGLAPSLVRAAPARRIGILWESREAFDEDAKGFLAELAARGWERGRNLEIIAPFFEHPNDDFSSAIARLVAAGAEVVIIDGTFMTQAMRRTAPGVPLVITCGDPVGAGFARSLAEPGLNITGVSQGQNESSAKCVQLLRSIAPHITRIGILYYDLAPHRPFAAYTEAVARREGLEATVYMVETDEAFPSIIRAIGLKGDGGAVVGNLDPGSGKVVAQAALAHRVPTVTQYTAHVEAGMLLSFRLYEPEMGARFAMLVDKILRGAKAGDLPFELPRSAEMFVNRRTAAALKLRIPEEILLRANRVIG